MKKLVIIVTMIFSLNIISLRAEEQLKEFSESNLSSQNYILYSIDEDEVLLEKNADVRLSAASINKVLTTITALDLLENENLDEDIIVYPSALHYLDLESSKAGLQPNEIVSLREVLYAIMLPSGADATAVMSMHLFNHPDMLAEAMNDKAKEIGMKDTNIVNVSGLDDSNQYTTLHDLLTLLKYALNNDDFKDIYTKSSYTFKNTDLVIENPILTMAENDDNSYIVGAKSGYTLDAKRALSSIATDGKQSYIFISTKAEGGPLYDNEAYHDANKVYKKVFNNDLDTIQNSLVAPSQSQRNVNQSSTIPTFLYATVGVLIALLSSAYLLRFINIQKIKKRKKAILAGRQNS